LGRLPRNAAGLFLAGNISMAAAVKEEIVTVTPMERLKVHTRPMNQQELDAFLVQHYGSLGRENVSADETALLPDKRPGATGPLVGALALMAVGVGCTFWMGYGAQHGEPMLEIALRAAIGAMAMWLGVAIAWKI
jgi:hypothetical protein